MYSNITFTVLDSLVEDVLEDVSPLILLDSSYQSTLKI